MTVTLSGLGISRGISSGLARLLDDSHLQTVQYHISSAEVEKESARYSQAMQQTVDQLQSMHTEIERTLDYNISNIIDTHILMLQDDTFLLAPIDIIHEQLCNAEWALQQQCASLCTIFEAMDDAYLRARREDIQNICNQIMRALVNNTQQTEHSKEDNIDWKDYILVTRDLSPAEVALYAKRGIKGLISTHGGPLSHSSIMARSLNLPAVAGVHDALQHITHNENIIIDGQTGLVVLGADNKLIKHYKKLKQQQQNRQQKLKKLRNKPATSQDGATINLYANVEQLQDVHAALDMGATGIGLYRTELLYLDRETAPDEEEQFETLCEVTRALRGKPLTIRTFDIGSDKTPPFFDNIEENNNPALGMRGIRLCLQQTQLFKPHLRAILRASNYGKIKIMLPMLSNIQEVRQTRTLIEQIKSQLDLENIQYDHQCEVGGMIEVPSAALSVHAFASELDFLSIGTNDLIQYMLAIDRDNDVVNYLYEPLNPSILKTIQYIIRGARQANTPVIMCGEMAGDSLYTRLLLGMGLRQFSVQPYNLLEVKNAVTETDISQLTRQVRKILGLQDSDLILEAISELNA